MPPGSNPGAVAVPLDLARSSGGNIWTCFKTVAPATFLGATQYVANGIAPTLLLRKTGGVKETRPLILDLSQDGTVAGGIIKCVIKADIIDRNTTPAQGTAWRMRSTSMEVAASKQPEFTVLENAAATDETGATADPRTIFDSTIFQTVSGLGTGFVFDFKNRVVLKSVGSLLIYIFSSTPAPTMRGTLLVAEE